MDRIKTTSQDRGRASNLARPWSDTKAVVVCLWSHEDIFNTLLKSCGQLPTATLDSRTVPGQDIVWFYNKALQEIYADFFLFCHQDVAGDIPAFIEQSLKFAGPKDIVGAIGKTKKNASVWRHNGDPIEVQTLDECCFGFYRNSGYTFDPQLHWTSYSQDICLLARSQGAKVWVPPNNIGHAHHRWGPWFIEQGHFQKEHRYVRHKWGGFYRS